MSTRLQLDMRNLSLGRRHLVNAYEVKVNHQHPNFFTVVITGSLDDMQWTR